MKILIFWLKVLTLIFPTALLQSKGPWAWARSHNFPEGDSWERFCWQNWGQVISSFKGLNAERWKMNADSWWLKAKRASSGKLQNVPEEVADTVQRVPIDGIVLVMYQVLMNGQSFSHVYQNITFIHLKTIHTTIAIKIWRLFQLL